MKRETIKLDGHHPLTLDVEHLSREEDLGLFEDRVWPFKQEDVTIMKPSIDLVMGLDPAKITGVNAEEAARRVRNMDSSSTEWYGGTHAEMLKRRLGWRQGVDKMLAMIEKIVPEYGYAKRPRPTFAGAGYQVSVDRAIDGHDKPWMARRRRWGPRSLTISVTYGENCDTSSEALYMRGAATVAAIDTLEDMGYRIELYAVNCNQGLFHGQSNHLTLVEVEVKRSQDPVDLDYLASTMCSPLFFRGNCFTLWTVIPKRAVSHLGSMRDVPEAYQKTVHVSELPKSESEARELYQEIVDKAVKSQETLDNVR